jgi:hypothetical protein
MLSEQKIIDALKRHRCPEEKIPEIMGEIGVIIFGKVLASAIAILPEETQAHINSLSSEDMQQYFTNHPEIAASITQAQFDSIHDATWQEYFKAIG